MIKYNLNNINDWNFGDDNIIKVYRNNAVCYYKITSGDTPTPVQEPCFAVVDNISQYSETEFEDVFNLADEKWYKLNNLNQYEQYGIYGSGRTSCEGSTSRLPQGYTEVEYIENTGTSYINTDLQIYSSTTNSFEVEAKLIAAKHDSQAYQNVFSCMSEDGEPYQGFTYRYQSSSLVGTSIPNGQNTFTIVNNEDSTQTVTVTSSSSQRTYTHTYPLTLFCGLNSSRNPFRWTNSKFYYCKIKINDELVRDFVPAKRNSDDKYGMYDLVTNTFYLSPNNVDLNGGEPIAPTDCVTTYEGKLTVDDGYEYMYSGAFADMYNLSAATIPASITGSSTNLFLRDSALKEVHFKRRTAPELGEDAFKDCTALVKIYIPDCDCFNSYKAQSQFSGKTGIIYGENGTRCYTPPYIYFTKSSGSYLSDGFTYTANTDGNLTTLRKSASNQSELTASCYVSFSGVSSIKFTQTLSNSGSGLYYSANITGTSQTASTRSVGAYVQYTNLTKTKTYNVQIKLLAKSQGQTISGSLAAANITWTQ